MRALIALVFVSACSGRCSHDSPSFTAPIDASVSPAPSASSTAESADASSDASDAANDASSVDDAGADAGCPSAHDDALARFKIFCAHEESCHPDDPELAPSDKPTKVADLDGDGIPEIIWGWGPIPVNTESHLYRGGQTCAVHLGSLGGSEIIKAQSTRHEGYRDIVTEDYGICEGVAGRCTPVIDGYFFHAGKYEIDPKKHVDGTVTLSRH